MSFAKIAEQRAVKKIVAYIHERAKFTADESTNDVGGMYLILADEIEAGHWKDIKLPKPAKKAKKR